MNFIAKIEILFIEKEFLFQEMRVNEKLVFLEANGRLITGKPDLN